MKPAEKAQIIAKVHARADDALIELFHNPFREAFATVPVQTHRETWAVRSRDFRFWVARALYDILGAAPPKTLVRDVLDEFEMHAVCRGSQHEVFTRIAETNGGLFIDLGEPTWKAVEVTSVGWRVVAEPPVKFQRRMGSAALPFPVRGSNLREVSEFLNIPPSQEQLILSWLSYCIRPSRPFPVLALAGVQGAGKSTATRILRSLIDPSVAMLTTTPRSERDLAIAASNSFLLALDNLSEISAEMSDALCRVSTGGSFRTRKLYTDNDEQIFCYMRPCIVNGIEELPQRPDLLDRSVLINLEPINSDRRQDETIFWRRFEALRPQIFGGLLDTVVAGLSTIDLVSVPKLPRMADFCIWGVAVERHLGYPEGSFLEAYQKNLEDAQWAAIESSPIAGVVSEFLGQDVFFGKAIALLKLLNEFLSPTADTARKHPRWPKSATALSAELARIEPNLRKLGIALERGRNHAGRFIRLSRSVTLGDARATDIGTSQHNENEQHVAA